MASSNGKKIGSLQLDSVFHAFVAEELLPATGLGADSFWAGLEAIINDLTPINRELLAKRDALQAKLDELLASVSSEPETDYFETHQYELDSDWEIAESDFLYTFVLRGHSYTGGAHSMPFVATFTYSKADHRRVELQDVLGDGDSLEEISRQATVHFRQALPDRAFADGLAASWENWENWFASNNRITFVFPVYQVGAFSDGEQSFSLMVEPATSHLFDLDYFVPLAGKIQVSDEHGHGPDPDSEESARAAAFQLVKASTAYGEDGFALRIVDAVRLPDATQAWWVDYTWQHFGDRGSLYAGIVSVSADQPEFVASRFSIVSAEENIATVLTQAWRTDRPTGSEAPVITMSTRLSDVLQTEHQHMEAFGLLQQRYSLGEPQMEELWKELSALGSVGEWVSVLTRSPHMAPR